MDQKEYLSSIFGLNGKTILITGASGGIGSAISKGVAQAVPRWRYAAIR